MMHNAEAEGGGFVDQETPSAALQEVRRDLTAEAARALEPGSLHYRAYVGSPQLYDAIAATQFGIMISLGLREHHTLLDIGCGSLCAGRLFIPYLLEGRYYGIEPQPWLVEDGIRYEVTPEQQALKRPTFLHDENFSISKFNTRFDFMLAQSILTHTSQAQLDRCLSEAKENLNPKGLFAASFYWDGKSNYEGDAWVYPAFASYSARYVFDCAAKHGLKAFPLIWTSTYSHYWVVFSHSARAEKLAWLGEANGEHKMFRIMQLSRELTERNEKYDKVRAELEQVKAELEALKG